jgi:hypothetical protein
MGRIIDDIIIHELSIVFSDHKGAQWLPVNGDAQMLKVKGGALKSEIEIKTTDKNSPGFAAAVAERLKAVYGPVAGSGDTDDEEADRYNTLVSRISTMGWDISSCWGISDNDARSVAVTVAIDNFLDDLDELRGAAKGGKRHSAADQAHIDALSAAHDKLGKALVGANKAHDAMSAHLEGLSPNAAPANDDGKATITIDASKALPEVEVGEPGADGLPGSYAVAAKDQQTAEIAFETEKANKSPYGAVAYADAGLRADGINRHPLDTVERATKAIAYFALDENRKAYTAEQLVAIDAALVAAKATHKIVDPAPVVKNVTYNIGDVSGGVEIAAQMKKAFADMQAQFEKQVADLRASASAEGKKAIDEALAAAKAESDKQITALSADLAKATGMLTKIVKEAAAPTASGFVATRNEDGTLTDPADPNGILRAEKGKELLTHAQSIGDVIKAQRLIHST